MNTLMVCLLIGRFLVRIQAQEQEGRIRPRPAWFVFGRQDLRVDGPVESRRGTPISVLLRWGDKSQDRKSIRVSLLYVTIV